MVKTGKTANKTANVLKMAVLVKTASKTTLLRLPLPATK